MRNSPNHIVHAHDVLRLVAGVVDNGGSRLHPDPFPSLTQEPVVFAHRLATVDYCGIQRKHGQYKNTDWNFVIGRCTISVNQCVVD